MTGLGHMAADAPDTKYTVTNPTRQKKYAGVNLNFIYEESGDTGLRSWVSPLFV